MRKIVLPLLITTTALLAKGQPITDRDLLKTPPPEASKSGYKVIKRVYKVVDKNATAEVTPPKQKYSYFVGASASFVNRERTVIVESKNTGDAINLNGQIVAANGTNYSMTTTDSELMPELEVGISSNDVVFYGVKLGLYEEFTELSIFSGIRFKNASYYNFTPYLQIGAGVGYKTTDGIEPDNLVIGGLAGVERFIKGDYLSFTLSASYKHVYWQEVDMPYGHEYWRDNEIGAKVAVKYAF